MASEAKSGLHVVPIRYQGHERARPASDPVDAYAASGAFDALGPATVAEPAFPEARRSGEPTVDLGIVGGEIAEAVAAGRRAGKPVLVVGGNCASVPGVVGGLQEAHGPAARIGLVWLDAHGDFNTPETSYSGILAGMPLAILAGLAGPLWRGAAGLAAPIPTDRILLAGVRELDDQEEGLLRSTSATI
ncbi:MAG TPA: arginase family protein, partial [Thermomicrobiales bacterium]|nr:arginase family protein [Thermomicrobiales bacterium]